MRLNQTLAQNHPANHLNDPAFVSEAKLILAQYASEIRHDYPDKAQPWKIDLEEVENLRANKVKTLTIEGSSRSEYNRQGELVKSQRLFNTRNKNSQSTMDDEYVLSDNNDLISLKTSYSEKPNEIHQRNYYYSGDTLYVVWTINKEINGIGIGYENLFIDKNVLTGKINISLTLKEEVEEGYAISELQKGKDDSLFNVTAKFIMSKQNSLLQLVRPQEMKWRSTDKQFDEFSTPGVWREKYSYDANRLRSEMKAYYSDRLQFTITYKRMENGLIKHEVTTYAPSFGTTRPKTRVSYQYEFHD